MGYVPTKGGRRGQLRKPGLSVPGKQDEVLFPEPGGSEDALPASLHCTGDDLKDQPSVLCPGSECHCGDSGDTAAISS